MPYKYNPLVLLFSFLDMHMYITSALQRTDMKAVGLQLALDLLHEKVVPGILYQFPLLTNFLSTPSRASVI